MSTRSRHSDLSIVFIVLTLCKSRLYQESAYIQARTEVLSFSFLGIEFVSRQMEPFSGLEGRGLCLQDSENGPCPMR